MSKKITKAIIAVAGYGTRFLPETKNVPKEMLPIVDKPIIQYLVEEASEAGITDIIIVTRHGQSAVEDHFDNNLELENSLAESGKDEYLKKIQDVTKLARIAYVRQHKHLPYGNGTPILSAKSFLGDDEAFVFMWGDDLTLSKKPVTKQMMEAYEKEKPSAVIAVQEVEKDQVYRYGIVEYKDESKNYEIKGLVEKPSVEETPSTMAQFGRFVLTRDILDMAEKTATGKGNELWLTDMLMNLVKEGKKVIAQPIEGEWLTTGDPLNYLKATVKVALQNKELSKDFKSFLKEVSS